MGAVPDTNPLADRAASASGRAPLPLPRRILRLRSDAALAERYASGDEAAFDLIYERHRHAVLSVCMGILGTAHDAEDATQETFSSLAQTLRTHPPKELRPWLMRVARNASIDTTRRRRHRLLTIDGEIPEIPARPHAGTAELTSVLDGIRELPESQRTALLMRELGGHSYDEIASFLEVDQDAVRGLIARARVGLRSYREAADFPCASARAAIEAEPDGRRHDKTVRRHLRGCSSCRAYRSALRGDAKALRAVFPWQAGGMAAGGIATGGAVTAAKSAIMGVGLTQIAATCAASVCAVGAVGGVVLLNPAHRIFNPIKLSAAPAAHRHSSASSKPATARAPISSHAAPATTQTSQPVSRSVKPAGAGQAQHLSRSSSTDMAMRSGHRSTWNGDGGHRYAQPPGYGSTGNNENRSHGMTLGGDSRRGTNSWSDGGGFRWSAGSFQGVAAHRTAEGGQRRQSTRDRRF